ncbi:MAG: bifunctional phosphoribosyl-AMP cyclohydrolase/phosphoribosyl-ATP diphosphatase HisIE [Helicobacter sp.]|nr:bifunctional phosphoribosyl-AMP cyclohydrolase/phosphoribosyl-ATP diphosphatase HisIE [Helicobacter sp.]
MHTIDWNRTPLIPAIAQDESGAVLMLAYMNKEALERTLATKEVHYFSRSKNRIWKKGETSGNTQRLLRLWVDCDSDCLLLCVQQKGDACHTLHHSCFFREIGLDGAVQSESAEGADVGKQIATYGVIETLYHTLCERKSADKTQSYTAQLFAKGENTIGKKIVEESAELAFAIKDKDKNDIVYEAADVLYHLLVGLASVDVAPEHVLSELARRMGTSGIAEKASRKA